MHIRKLKLTLYLYRYRDSKNNVKISNENLEKLFCMTETKCWCTDIIPIARELVQ